MFVSSSKLTAAISATDVATAMTARITVANPTPGGGTSPALSLRVREAAPRIVSVSPGTLTAGSGTSTVEITGSSNGMGSRARRSSPARRSLR